MMGSFEMRERYASILDTKSRISSIRLRFSLAGGILLFIFCVCARQPSSAQDNPQGKPLGWLRPEILAIVERIAEAGSHDSERVGATGVPSEVYATYKELRELATAEEIRLLTEHASPVVRVYAFQALVERGGELFDQLWLRRDDLARLATMHGCIMAEQQVADMVLDMAWDELDPGQRDLVLDHLLKGGGPAGFRHRALLQLEPFEAYYHQIRGLAMRGETSSALVALARFRRDADTDIILAGFADEKQRYYALLAMETFPHQAFLGASRDYLATFSAMDGWTTEQRACYGALAAYESEDVVPLLEQAFEIPPELRRYHLEFLSEALARHLVPEFVPLAFRVLDTGMATPELVAGLAERAPGQLAVVAPSLIRTPHRFGPETLERLVGILLAQPSSHERTDAVNAFLAAANVHEIGIAA